MIVTLKTAPVLEPITLNDLKEHLHLDSGTFDGNLDLDQSLSYGSHAIANNYTTHVGTGIDVLGREAVAVLHCGTNGAGGTNDTRIEESDDNTTFTPWTGGAFAQVTTDGAGATEPDNADYKLPYTGTKQYIRTASKVLVAPCEFGTSILVNEATTAEDSALERLRKAARRKVEGHTSRGLLTQTWDYYLQKWPDKDFIRLPFGNLQNGAGTAPVVSWKDTDGTETTLTVTTDYLVETNGQDCGRIVLPYGGSWPSGTLYPSNPIKIEFFCGWTAAADVPEDIVSAVLLMAEKLYFRGEREEKLKKAINSLLDDYRIPWEFE